MVSTDALNLGVVRAVVSGVFLLSVLTTSFAPLSVLPITILRPTGLMKLVPWSVYDQLLTTSGMSFLKWSLVVSLLMSTFGYLTVVTTKTSFLLVLFYQGLLRSFGHFNHDEMIGIYFLLILAFTPCGDAFSIDSWPKLKRNNRGFRYGYPVLLMMLLMAWVYFSSALVKLRVAGWNYFSPDNLPALAIYHSLDNLHDTQFKIAFWLPQVRRYLPFVVGLVLLWELLFPLAVFWKRSRKWILGFGIVFHLATLPLMNIFFPHQLALYLVFVDWPKLVARMVQGGMLSKAAAWWRSKKEPAGNFAEVSAGGDHSGRLSQSAVLGPFTWLGHRVLTARR